jgi:hypothetical protein
VAPTFTPARPAVPATGILRLVIEPWAFVRIDGGAETQSPVRPLTLGVGEHKLQLFRDGFRTIERTILIEPGQTSSFEFQLQRERFGSLKLILDGAPWAYFRIDDGAEQQLPHSTLRLSDGEHILNVYREGFQRVLRRFEVRPDQETEIRIELKPTSQEDPP